MDYTEIAESLIKTVEDSTVKTILSQLEHLINKGILKVKKNEGKYKLIGENKHLRQLIKTLSQIAGEA